MCRAGDPLADACLREINEVAVGLLSKHEERRYLVVFTIF